jgi:hypothetical protein
MTRSFARAALAALLLCAFPPGADGASAKPAKMHHVTGLDGLSIDAPEGFVACDPESNRQLGNAPHPAVPALDHICSEFATTADTRVLLSAEDRFPILLFVRPVHDQRIPVSFFRDIPSDSMDTLTKAMCAYMAKDGPSLTDCTVSHASLGGREAIEAKAVMSTGAESASARFFYLPERGGTLVVAFVLFNAPGADAALSQAMIGRMLATAHMPPEPPPPTGSATLTAAAGVTLTVPKTWIACDAANAALLGNTPDPYDLHDELCPGNAAVRVVRLNGAALEYLHAEVRPMGIDADAFAASLSDDALAQARPRDCQDLSGRLEEPGAGVTDCTTAAGTLAGRPAKVTTFSITFVDPQTKLPYHGHARVIATPVKDGLLTVLVQAVSFSDPKISDQAEAIVSSVAVQ